MVLAGGTTSQLDCPAEACGIAAELEIEAPALDIRSACTSFGAAVQLLWMMDPSQLPDFVLVVNPETVTRTVDYTDRSSAVLWGDAAVAVIVSKRHPAAAASSAASSRPTPGAIRRSPSTGPTTSSRTDRPSRSLPSSAP